MKTARNGKKLGKNSFLKQAWQKQLEMEKTWQKLEHAWHNPTKAKQTKTIVLQLCTVVLPLVVLFNF